MINEKIRLDSFFLLFTTMLFFYWGKCEIYNWIPFNQSILFPNLIYYWIIVNQDKLLTHKNNYINNDDLYTSIFNIIL